MAVRLQAVEDVSPPIRTQEHSSTFALHPDAAGFETNGRGQKVFTWSGEDDGIAGGHLVDSALYRARAGAFSVAPPAGFGIPGRAQAGDGKTGQQQVKARSQPVLPVRHA